MTMGLLKFVTSKVLAIIVAWGLILFDEQLRRRDTVESKRIFNLALQNVIGWNLHIDYAIYKSYEHVKNKQEKSFIPAAILSVIFVVAHVALSEVYVEGYQAVQVITAFTIICLVLQVLCVISAIQIVLKAKKGRKPPSFLRMDAFLVPVIVGSILYNTQLMTQFEPRDLCFAIAAVLTWISVKNSYKYVDPHTGLYNLLCQM